MEATVLGAKDKLCNLEYELFCGLRDVIAENNDIDEKTAPVSDASPHVGAEEDASDVDVVDSVEEGTEVSAQDVQKTIEDDPIDEKDMESPVENPENNDVEDSDNGMEVPSEGEQVAPADDDAAYLQAMNG